MKCLLAWLGAMRGSTLTEMANRDEHTLHQLLQRLADGEYHSGDELGDWLGISRAAVWKQLRKLGEVGLPLESVRGRGYRLTGGLELLSERRLREALSLEANRLVTALDVLSVTDSTNARAMLRAAEGQSGYICLAEQQTAGRGRRGRTWVSPFGQNLYLSVSWGFDGGATQLEGLSLAVGVALCEQLAALGLKDLGLKWPNDLLWREQKLAGILLEMTGDPAGHCCVVIGVGLNMAMPESAALSIEQPWVDLATACVAEGCEVPGRHQVAAGLIERLVLLLKDYHHEGFSSWRQRWECRDAFRNREVLVSSGTSSRSGIARGVDESGALRLEVEGEYTLCHGGELSMRPVK